MKNEFTIRKGIQVLLSVAGIILISVDMAGQVSHTVTVSNFSFSPNEFIITTGDTVIWKNVSGSHNVNGTTLTYPLNPESFGNAVSTGWTYSHIFNIPGNYDYRCDPHFSSGMTGKITVQQSTGITGTIAEDQVLIYPNPARDYIAIDLQHNGEKLESVRIVDLLGKELISSNDMAGSTNQRFDVSRFNPGVYLMQVETDSKTRILRFIIR